MAAMQIFLSHSSADRAIAEKLVVALRGAGADVWFDEHNLGPGVILKDITRQLRARPVFIVLLSQRAIGSEWVQNECEWAFNLRMNDPSRIILPVVIEQLKPAAMDELLYFSSFKRIEGPNHTPYPEREMLDRTLRLLALTPAGAPPIVSAPWPGEAVDDMMTQGQALAAQQRWAEALPFFQRATAREPDNANAWGNQGWMLNELKRYDEAETAYNRALELNDQLAWVWNNKGANLNDLNRYDEALTSFGHALAFDSTDPIVWYNRGNALYELGRYQEALEAYDRGFDRDDARDWRAHAKTYRALGRNEEAVTAYQHALEIAPNDAVTEFNMGNALYELGRYHEALAAYDRGFDRNDYRDWRAHAKVYRALGRHADAEAAERRAKELGG
jgi:tetratricopeptide (TPR) repeat protein